MKDKGWEHVISSDIEYEKLVAELYYNDQFLLLLDREDGRDKVKVAFPTENGKTGIRIDLEEFIERIKLVAEDLRM